MEIDQIFASSSIIDLNTDKRRMTSQELIEHEEKSQKLLELMKTNEKWAHKFQQLSNQVIEI